MPLPTYILTLPQGAITRGSDGKFRGQLFTAKELAALKPWSPNSPEVTGWKKGDTLAVIATFDTALLIDPATGAAYPMNEQPKPSDFYGLSVDALYKPTAAQVTAAETALKRQVAGVIGSGITSGSLQNNTTDLFCNAESSTSTVSLEPTSRGSFTVVSGWTMAFNADYVPSDGLAFDTKKVEFIFGYGDPMLSESMT